MCERGAGSLTVYIFLSARVYIEDISVMFLSYRNAWTTIVRQRRYIIINLSPGCPDARPISPDWRSAESIYSAENHKLWPVDSVASCRPKSCFSRIIIRVFVIDQNKNFPWYQTPMYNAEQVSRVLGIPLPSDINLCHAIAIKNRRRY